MVSLPAIRTGVMLCTVEKDTGEAARQNIRRLRVLREYPFGFAHRGDRRGLQSVRDFRRAGLRFRASSDLLSTFYIVIPSPSTERNLCRRIRYPATQIAIPSRISCAIISGATTNHGPLSDKKIP